MASLIRSDGVLFETTDVAPSPCKDFWQVLVTVNEVILRWWKISLRNDAKIAPGQLKESYQDFLDDYRAHSDIQMNFGKNTLEYVTRLAQGHIDYLPRLSDKLLINIIQFLGLDDISRLAVVSKQFNKLCQSDELWRSLYLGVSLAKCRTADAALETLAQEVGWRKLYFTNKLQLQVQLRRQKNKKSPRDWEGDEERMSPAPHATVSMVTHGHGHGHGDGGTFLTQTKSSPAKDINHNPVNN
jgi:F-box protein 36